MSGHRNDSKKMSEERKSSSLFLLLQGFASNVIVAFDPAILMYGDSLVKQGNDMENKLSFQENLL